MPKYNNPNRKDPNPNPHPVPIHGFPADQQPHLLPPDRNPLHPVDSFLCDSKAFRKTCGLENPRSADCVVRPRPISPDF